MLLAAALAFDGIVAWAIWRMVRQSWQYESLAAPQPGARRDWPRIAVVVPARDEADVIGRCVSGLLNQDYPADRMNVLLVDDGSTDGTASLAALAARGDPRFRVQRGTALPAGWTGKSHACWQGAKAAGSPDYICFVDADTCAAPDLMRAALSHAASHELDLLSLEPFQELGSMAERLVIPCGFYLIAASQDIAAINAPGHPAAAANGQFLLFRRSAYDRVGGHAAVRAEVCEDAALAALTKRAGLRFALLGADPFIRTRMYRDWRTLWIGLSKNASVVGGGPLKTVLIAAAGLALVAAGLVLAGLGLANCAGGRTSFDLPGSLVLLCGLGALFGLHLAGTRHFRIPLAYGFLFPIGYLLTLALAVDSARLFWLGRVRWKGRTYAPCPPKSGDAASRRLHLNGTHADTGA